MDYRAWAIAPKIPSIQIAMVTAAMAVLMLSGCSNSSDSPNMNNPIVNNTTVTSAELIDPAGEIAQIKFESAEVDAIYQCLLSAATASATSRGLQAYPVVNETDRNTGSTGVYATWCKTVGTSEDINADIASCRRYLKNGVSAPGTEALNLYADTPLRSEEGVKRIELESIKIPEEGSSDFKVVFLRSRGVSTDEEINSYTLSFVPFDGETYNKDLSVYVGRGYGYYDPDTNIRGYYIPEETVAEHMSLLSSSAEQFKTTATSHFEILRSQVETAINTDSSLDDDAKQVALAKAKTEIDRNINLIVQNSESFHRLLVEQFAIEQCG